MASGKEKQRDVAIILPIRVLVSKVRRIILTLVPHVNQAHLHRLLV
ncbi:MAG TPA: hypothetical protein VF944_08100 [Candidatus Bathyarchaeia archaeon]